MPNWVWMILCFWCVGGNLPDNYGSYKNQPNDRGKCSLPIKWYSASICCPSDPFLTEFVARLLPIWNICCQYKTFVAIWNICCQYKTFVANMKHSLPIWPILCPFATHLTHSWFSLLKHSNAGMLAELKPQLKVQQRRSQLCIFIRNFPRHWLTLGKFKPRVLVLHHHCYLCKY